MKICVINECDQNNRLGFLYITRKFDDENQNWDEYDDVEAEILGNKGYEFMVDNKVSKQEQSRKKEKKRIHAASVSDTGFGILSSSIGTQYNYYMSILK